MKSSKQKVLIIGGGFCGIKAALDLSKSALFDITFISDNPDFRFAPRVYRATTGTKHTVSSIPLDTIFRGKQISYIKDSAVSVDRHTKTVSTITGASYNYDELIIALNGIPNHFNMSLIGDLAYCVSTPSEADRLNSHIHELVVSPKKPALNFLIVGGGTTGVEVAGGLRDFVLSIVDAHNISHRHTHIDLVEAKPRILSNLSHHVSKPVYKRLKNMGVHIRTNTTVETVGNKLVISGKTVNNHTLIWAGGNAPHPFFAANGFKTQANGKAIVDVYLQAAPDIYVVGDDTGTAYNGLASSAWKDGAYIANNIVRKAEGLLMVRYTQPKPTYIIPVGGKWSAVGRGNRWLHGLPGWLLQSMVARSLFGPELPWSTKPSKQSKTTTNQKCPVCMASSN